MTFSGSYDPADVRFLLTPVDVPDTPVAEKERLIQSGARHYSEMITRERRPSAAYLRVFHAGLDREKARLARDLIALAGLVAARQTTRVARSLRESGAVGRGCAAGPVAARLPLADRAGHPGGRLAPRVDPRPATDTSPESPGPHGNPLAERAGHPPITIVSLARAGTPVGVLLARTLRTHFGRNVEHYSVSIVRDRGIDEVALKYVLARHAASSVIFVDGWTGKGVIAGELDRAVRRFNASHAVDLDPGLFAVADLSGTAAASATTDDYLIPSCVLGATVSGLVSRSIVNADVVGPGDFHGCLYYREFEPDDLSRPFADVMSAEIARQWEPGLLTVAQEPDRPALRQRSADFIAYVRERYGVRDVNFVKPGIGEATRVLLRRVPDRLLVRDPADPGVAHLLVLATEKNVPVETDPALPYRAAALIRGMDG